jgi:RNA polymerase sigma factor for flagellar operon FliA
MFTALHTAASGMKAQPRNLDALANNSSNLNTTGDRASCTESQELMVPSQGGAADAMSVRCRRLVEEYGGLVKTVARRIMRRLPREVDGIEMMDLINVGLLGLIEADNRFDQNAGYAFEAFAEFRVKGAMLDELRRNDFFPRRLRQKANRLNNTTQALCRELGREPTDEEVALRMEMTGSDLQQLKDDVTPYHYVSPEDVWRSLVASEPDAFKLIAYAETRQQLVDAISTLADREQLIIDLYFVQELTLREIAEILEVTVGRVSQIKTATLAKLRTQLGKLAIHC